MKKISHESRVFWNNFAIVLVVLMCLVSTCLLPVFVSQTVVRNYLDAEMKDAYTVIKTDPVDGVKGAVKVEPYVLKDHIRTVLLYITIGTNLLTGFIVMGVMFLYKRNSIDTHFQNMGLRAKVLYFSFMYDDIITAGKNELGDEFELVDYLTKHAYTPETLKIIDKAKKG